MPGIQRFDREEFIAERWAYKPGQHVSIIGETGNGKTTLAGQLLAATATPEVPAIILGMKPRDDTLDKFHGDMKAAGTQYRKVRDWPPRHSLWEPAKPHGYILSPKHTFDTYADNEHHSAVFEAAILDSYKRGKRIIFADEAVSLSKELKLGDHLDTIWTKGRSMGTGIWAATQRPAWVPRNMFCQASHLFLDWPSDKQSRDRYREIGGMDPDVVLKALWQSSEEEFAWTYLQPNGRRSTICIVGA